MGAVGDEPELDPGEQIIQTATRLFAALGYDGTPIKVIAEASGFDVATITALVGDKQTLYRTVIHRVQAGQWAMFDAAIASFTPDRAGVHRMADSALDYCVAHPEIPALWMHRWQSDAADITELERVYFQPMLNRLRALLDGLAPADTDLELALLTVAWCIRCFCMAGVGNKRGEREGPENPKMLKRFRRHLHWLTDQVFELGR